MRLELQETAPNEPVSRRFGREELKSWRAELDHFYEVMGQFGVNEDTIFQDLSSMSARVSQMRSLVVRVENKALQVFRTQEIDPFLKECDRQFKLWSRVLTVHQHEWELTTR